MANTSNTGFFAGLFDFTFTKFITTRLAPVIYFIGMALIGVSSLFFAVSGFARGFTAGVVTLIIGPLIFLIGLLYLRVILEVIVVSFKTAENTRQTAENTRQL